MEINGVYIDDTFAEAFSMQATRILITADTLKWAMVSAESMIGFATSIIACGCEAAIERILSATETPDKRVGVSVLLFARTLRILKQQLQKRLGQCVLTAPTTACFAGLNTEHSIPLGDGIRYFGDGWQIAKHINEKRYWRIPVMEGEFLCEATTGVVPAVGGGNFFILATTPGSALQAAEIATQAMQQVANVIMPFPGGIARSGSKVGSKYAGLIASTHHEFCPTLKGQVASALDMEIESVLEIVVDGLTLDSVRRAMKVGILTVCQSSKAGVKRISAGNYGGKLGQFHLALREILS